MYRGMCRFSAMIITWHQNLPEGLRELPSGSCSGKLRAAMMGCGWLGKGSGSMGGWQSYLQSFRYFRQTILKLTFSKMRQQRFQNWPEMMVPSSNAS